jgi:hypothetical protein
MKKSLLLSFAVLFVIGMAGVSYASVDSMYEAAIIDVSGDVKVDPNADGGWFSPWVGMKLKEGALLKTGAGSSAQIVFDAEGLNILEIKENSSIAVRKSMAELPEGSVLANFANLTGGSTFTVKTPTAACSIRGSGMGVDHIQGMTVVMAYEDKVYVQGLDANGNPVGKEVVIPESWKAAVRAGGRIEPPTELTANEQAIWDAFVAATAAGVGLAPEPAQVPGDSDSKDLDEVKAEETEPSVSPSS